MFDRFWRKGPQFNANDVLPFVHVPPGEKPIVLDALDVSVVITGMFAETSQTMVFRNPNRRALEGQLGFPLPDHGVVCGYAIDVDGELVDGVIVEKKQARKILEAEIRKGVDPGLVEQVQGNLYRTRIYPLPPGGTRTVRITYVSDLVVNGTSAGYHLPLAHATSVERVSLRVEITQGEVTPVISGGVGNLTLAQLRGSHVAEAKLPRGAACDDLVVRLPDLPRHLRAVERSRDETYFAISSAVPEAGRAWTPARVTLVWDASGSRGDVDRDLELVTAMMDAWPQLVVDVRVVRDTLDAAAETFTGRPGRDELVGYLRALPRDGGTGLAGLDLATLTHADAEACLVFSDGLNTLRRGVPGAARVPVIAVSSAVGSDAAYLRHLATRSGGVFIDLLHTPAAAAVTMIAGARDALRVTGTDGCADVHVHRAAGRLSIVGRLTAEVGQVRLAGSGAPDDHVSIPRAKAIDGGLVARAWAGQHTRALAVADPEHPDILALARRHGVITANASLLVLDSLEQHLEHGVEPAASRTALRKQYLADRDRTLRTERATKASHIEQVVALWNERVRWWETDFTPRPAPKHDKAKRGARPAGGAMDGEMAGAPASTAFEDSLSAPMEMEMARSSAASPPLMARMAAPSPARSAAAPGGGGPPRARDEGGGGGTDGGGARGASIQIKPWTPDTPYLTALKDSREPYPRYLDARAQYAGSPAFFLDCGDFFLARGERVLGLRVLSNLLELGLDDPALMRMYAWRLQAAGELDGAIDVFERVRRMRDDEPQSHRDLALALGERWEASGVADDALRAMNLLYDVIEQAWERFPEIELIALMELNRLIAKAQARGLATPARIDPRLVRLLDLDVRISMAWDLDLTDVDLHVFEPNGDHAYYGANLSSGGGLVSRDFRQGYGPEEYVRRVAEAGVYAIKAHYYGSAQQDIAGACTVIVQVMVNYGRPNEQRQTLTLRLDKPSDQVVVGEITFEGGAKAEADWRPRFTRLRVGMAIDEIVNVVGQPTRIEGSNETVLVYELAPGQLVHVVVAPRLTAVRQIMDGAELDIL